MSLPESQGVSMPSFMLIGPKLWALDGYIHTHTQTDSPSFIIQTSLACHFVPAGYSVALLHQAFCFVLAFLVALLSRASSFALRSCNLFASLTSFTLTNFFFKKCVSIHSKCSKMHRNEKKKQKKLFLRLWPDRCSVKRVRQSATLPHVTPRVPRSVHAKFHVDWSKIMGARGIHTHTHTDRQPFFYYID